VVDEQKLHLPLARLLDFFVVDVDLHAVADGRGATGLQFRHALDFDEAHAALPDDRERRVIAEVGNVDVGSLGGLDAVDPVLHFDFDSVDGNFSHRLLLRCRLSARCRAIRGS
jgi:hypothetical protein